MRETSSPIFQGYPLNRLQLDTSIRSFGRFSENGGLASHAYCLACNMSGLSPHDTSLSFYSPQGSICGANAYNAHDDQDCTKSLSCLVHPVSCYRHGGKFGDCYGLLCIWGCWIAGGCFFAYGLLREVLRRRRWSDLVFMLAGFSLSLLGSLLGAIGCLPWGWWRCLHDGKEHSKEQDFHSPISRGGSNRDVQCGHFFL